MATKKMSLNAWINSQLKNKGMTASQAKKNAGKYKSIAAAKKGGSLYYTNKDGKIMIAAYAEDLKMPLPRPKEKEKKITKTDLGPPSPPKRKKDTSNLLIDGNPSKKDLIITQINRIKSKTGKTIGAGEKAELNKALEKIKDTGKVTSQQQKLLDRIESMADKRKQKMNKGGMMMKKKGYAKGGMMKKKGYAKGGAMKKPAAGQTGLKKLPTAVRNKMGYMSKGGMMKKKGYAKGGRTR